jgi:hypothetical protein
MESKILILGDIHAQENSLEELKEIKKTFAGYGFY